MLTPKSRFQEQKSPKSRTQYNFQKHISKRISTFMKQIWLPDFMGKSQGNLPYWFHAAENAVFANQARCLPVQSFHNSPGTFRVHASVTFLVNGDNRPLLMGCFLKCLEMSPFCWRWFCRCMINRLGRAFPQTQNIFDKWHPDSDDLFSLQLCRCNVLFRKLRRNFLLLRVFRARAEHFQKQICIFLSFAHAHRIKKWLWKVRAQKLQLLSEKIKKAVFVFVFSWMRESRTLEWLSVYLECPIDFDDIREQIWYSHNR